MGPNGLEQTFLSNQKWFEPCFHSLFQILRLSYLLCIHKKMLRLRSINFHSTSYILRNHHNMVFLLSITIFTALANAIAFSGPSLTSTLEATSSPLQGWTPLPTQNAEFFHDLRKRADASVTQLGFYVNDNTCGYVSGRLGMPALLRTTRRVEADLHQERAKPVRGHQVALQPLLARLAFLAVWGLAISLLQPLV
jgi:hypothetical protein